MLDCCSLYEELFVMPCCAVVWRVSDLLLTNLKLLDTIRQFERLPVDYGPAFALLKHVR